MSWLRGEHFIRSGNEGLARGCLMRPAGLSKDSVCYHTIISGSGPSIEARPRDAVVGQV